jgi:hypothetical protein
MPSTNRISAGVDRCASSNQAAKNPPIGSP